MLHLRALVSGGIGDELLTLPALRYLADVLPGARLEVLLGGWSERRRLFERLLERPSVAVLPLESFEAVPRRSRAGGRSCDWLLDLDARAVPPPAAHLEGRSGTISVKRRPPRHVVWKGAFAAAFSLARLLGVERRRGWRTACERLRVVRRAGPRRRARSRAPRVAISPGGNAPREKRWPLTRFARLAIGFLEIGCDVVVLGGPADVADGRDLVAMVGDSPRAGKLTDLTGRTRLEETPDVLSRTDLHLANDNGLLHVGGTLDIVQVGLYLGPRSRHLTPGRRDLRIFSGHGQMEAISVERVARACGDALERRVAL